MCGMLAVLVRYIELVRGRSERARSFATGIFEFIIILAENEFTTHPIRVFLCLFSVFNRISVDVLAVIIVVAVAVALLTCLLLIVVHIMRQKRKRYASFLSNRYLYATLISRVLCTHVRYFILRLGTRNCPSLSVHYCTRCTKESLTLDASRQTQTEYIFNTALCVVLCKFDFARIFKCLSLSRN